MIRLIILFALILFSVNNNALLAQNCEPFPVQILGDNLLCEGQTATLTADVGNSFLWSTGTTTATITVTTAGIYSLTVTDANGCTSTNFSDVIVFPNPTPQIIGNNSICPNGVATLALSTNYLIYIWSTGSDDASVQVNNAGTYTVTVYDSNACSATTAINVTPNPAATATLIGNDSFCEGGSTTIGVAETGQQYTWSTGNTSQSVVVNVAGVYTVTVSNSLGCSSTQSMLIAMGNAPVSIQGETTICGDTLLVLSVTPEYDTYIWSTGENTPTIQVGDGGTYTVTVSEATCEGSSSHTITAFPTPQVQISGNLTISAGISTELSAIGTDLLTYNWSSGGITPNLQVSQIGTYTVTVTDSNNCTATATAAVTEEILYLLAIPTAFSPNEDDVNSYWGVTAQDVMQYECHIYDRWGREIFEARQIDQRWDGTWQGKAQEMGIYVYWGNVRFGDGTQKKFKGNLTLIR